MTISYKIQYINNKWIHFCAGRGIPLFSIQFLNFTQKILSMKTENISLYGKTNNMPDIFLGCISLAISTIKKIHSFFHRGRGEIHGSIYGRNRNLFKIFDIPPQLAFMQQNIRWALLFNCFTYLRKFMMPNKTISSSIKC